MEQDAAGLACVHRRLVILRRSWTKLCALVPAACLFLSPDSESYSSSKAFVRPSRGDESNGKISYTPAGIEQLHVTAVSLRLAGNHLVLFRLFGLQ